MVKVMPRAAAAFSRDERVLVAAGDLAPVKRAAKSV
jgi:hypothetical protein